MCDVENWLLEVASALQAKGLDDFAGLGLVFYTDREALPVLPLIPESCKLDLPTTTLSDSVDFLSKIVKRASVYHDGFHLVHAKELVITDISQFLSPQIPERHIDGDRIIGARQMAAKLTSLIPSVYLTAIYTVKNQVTVYKGGEEKAILFSPKGA